MASRIRRNIASGPQAAREAVVVIPARLGSTRFPRKVLARETGKYLIQHVWEGAAGAPGVSRTIIATDSPEVVEAARSFGAEAWLTSPTHLSGTDRVAEVARSLSAEIVVNVQGDEPLIRKEDVAAVISLFQDAGEDVSMTTLAVERRDSEGLRDPNNVKVVLDLRGRALYFSRSPIPGNPERAPGRNVPQGSEEPAPWLHHVGIYGYRRQFLLGWAGMRPGALEKIERLEQLRAIENGFEIRVGLTARCHRGIDTEEEYREFLREYGPAARPAR